MHNPNFVEDIDDVSSIPVIEQEKQQPVVTAAQLKLVNKKIPMRYCEFQITNTGEKMTQTETTCISALGIQFNGSASATAGSLMRVWIEMPDYWARKSRHVGYRHTEAPTHFQILARVVSCVESGKRNAKYQILCQTLNLDAVDEAVLAEYLGGGRSQ